MPYISHVSISLFVFLNASIIMKDAVVEDATSEIQEIDPVVTGQTVNEDYIDEWQSIRAKYLECGKCAIEPQPFPGD